MLYRSLILALLALSLNGCDLFNPYEAPVTPQAPETFSEAPKPDGAHPLWPKTQWWEMFESTKLNALMAQAQEKNYDLAAAVARVRQADAQASISSAPLLPAINADSDARHVSATNSSLPQQRPEGNTFSASLNASYEIDFWGENRSNSNSAEALRDASIYDQQTVLLTITSSLANLYFDALATKERIAVAQKNIAASEAILAAMNRRFANGVSNKIEVVQQENLLATSRATLPTLQLRLTQTQNAIALLLGQMPESMQPFEETLSAIALPTIPQAIPSQLLQRRPDVQSAEAALIAAHADINAARAAFFPSISLTAGNSFASRTVGSLFDPAGQLISVGSAILQPIFQGGALDGRLDLATARADERTQQYQQSILNAFTDVENAFANLQRSSEIETQQSQAEKSAQAAFELTQRQFDSGITDITTVLNTQRNLFVASDAHLQSTLMRLQALVGVYRALGGGWVKGAMPEQNTVME